MNETLTAAVVGGGTGGSLSLNALVASPLFAPVALADLRADVRAQWEAKIPGLRTFQSHTEMLARLPTDVVCVSTFPPSHEEVTRDALASGTLKGILVEKPLGHTAQSGRRILEMVKAAGTPVAVPHNLRALSTPLEIIARVRGGELGQLYLVEIQCRGWDIINAGIHWMNFFVTLTHGDPVKSVHAAVDAASLTFRDGMQVETDAVTVVETRSGIRAVMYTGDYTTINVPGKDFVFRLIGAGGVCEFYGWESGYLWNGARVTPEPFAISGHRRHLESMTAQIGTTPNYEIAESSLSALEICEAAYHSGNLGVRVDFPYNGVSAPLQSDWIPGEPYNGVGGGRDGRQLS